MSRLLVTLPAARRFLRHTDALLDELEVRALDHPRARRVPDDLWERLEDVRDHLDYFADVPDTVHAAHDWLLRLQGARLLRVTAPTRTARRAGAGASWKFLGLPAGADQPDWPERAEMLLERLLDRWSWATEWARRDPSPATLTAAGAAWENYTAMRSEFDRMQAGGVLA